MRMNEIIRKKRREKGLTQEQVAACLGVTAPAVNKWESGASLPDLALLLPLSRLLETDPNTLLGFHGDLTKEEAMLYINEIAQTAKDKGMEETLFLIRKRVREYPSCGALLYQAATLLRGMAILFPVSEARAEENRAYAVSLYERAMNCADMQSADLSRYALASLYIQEKNYEKAEELIGQMPEYQPLDKKSLQIQMYIQQKKNEDAAVLLERKLNSSIQEIFLMLDQLATVTVREGNIERARELARYSRQVMEIYPWDYSTFVVEFTVAAEARDADRCLELLEQMLQALSVPFRLEKSVLFAHQPAKEPDPAMGRQIKETLLTALERDEEYAFIREQEGYQELRRKYAGR